MNNKTNPMSAMEPWDLVAGGYAETTMLIFEQFAEAAIEGVGLKPGATVLDVACGPGTLSLKAARTAGKIHGIDFSKSMLDCFEREIERAGHGHIETHHGDAQALPYEDNTFDNAFSLFGLMFFPDRGKGFAEIHRTLKPGGTIAVTSWAPVDQSPAMQMMFGALRTIKPELPEPQRAIDTLENPELFEREMHEAGFTDVSIRSVTGAFPVDSVVTFWEDMVKGGAPLQLMKKAMGEDIWREKEKLAIAFLEENLATIPTTLSSDAWLGTGVKRS